MSSLPKDKERKQLEQELHSIEYQSLLQRLQQEYPFYRDFSSWVDVLIFMRAGTSRDSLKDKVLRPILTAHAQDNDYHWRTVLLVVFWPGLKSLCIRSRSWDWSSDELWANAVWAFFEGVCGLNLTKRSERLVQKLINDTASNLKSQYRSEQERAAFEIPTDPELLEYLAGGQEDFSLMAVDFLDEQDAQVRRFRQHLQAGLISNIDFDLLVGTFVYGRCLRECAEEAGLSYQAAKKRRQRAVFVISHIEKFQEKSKSLSPPRPLSPLCTIGGEGFFRA